MGYMNLVVTFILQGEFWKHRCMSYCYSNVINTGKNTIFISCKTLITRNQELKYYVSQFHN